MKYTAFRKFYPYDPRDMTTCRYSILYFQLQNCLYNETNRKWKTGNGWYKVAQSCFIPSYTVQLFLITRQTCCIVNLLERIKALWTRSKYYFLLNLAKITSLHGEYIHWNSLVIDVLIYLLKRYFFIYSGVWSSGWNVIVPNRIISPWRDNFW